MFEKLSDRLERSFKLLKGQGRITEINVAETLKDVRRALLDADVNYRVAKTFTDTVKQKALGQNVINAIKPGELMVKIVHDELASLMGGHAAGIEISGKPAIILMSGLQGSGKTTFTGKLAKKLKAEKGLKPLLVACDVYRPAAIDQLKVLANSIDVPVYTEDGVKDPVGIARRAIEYARTNRNDLVIVDTAGRLAVDTEMMDEIEAIKNAINPGEILFVVDAMTGQDAVNPAKAFNDRLDFSGVVITKLDGDTRGGAALSIRSVVEKPIKFIGTGESLEGIDVFYPERMANRILGMGDVLTLIEKAQETIDEEKARELEQKMKKAEFDFERRTVMLNSGYEMPVNGLGTYSLHGDECINSVKSALSNGVRLIDTASAYGNEEEIGQAVREAIDEGIIKREDIFVTTKIYPGGEMENPVQSIQDCLDRLDIGYVDLMLLHHPDPNDVEAYKAMEQFVEEGEIRSIGLSNWYEMV